MIINLTFAGLTFFISGFAHSLVGGVELTNSDSLGKSTVGLQMIEKNEDGDLKYYKGSGILISDRIVLTAGHNFFYLADPSLSSAIFSFTPNWGPSAHGEKRVKIKKVIVLPGFSQGPQGTKKDLALALLSESAPKGYLPLKMNLDNGNLPLLGERLMVLGYGKSSFEATPPVHDFRLRQISVPFARWEDQSALDSEKFWVSHSGGSITAGDSGGPAILYRGGEHFVIGVVIHTRYDECVGEGFCESQGAFTNLFYFKDWIQNSILELNNQISKAN